MWMIPEGLTDAQAERARETYGANTLTRRARKSFWRQYLASFGDPIIRILLVALGVNLVFLLGASFSWYEPAGIAAAILIATLVATVSEYGNESAFEKLQAEAARIRCKVRRNGELRETPIDDIVVGDIVLLQPGDRVPADGLLIQGSLDADQSALNGESREARKYPASASTRADDFDARNRLFRGAVVTGGEGIMHVLAVGDHSFYGKLALDVQEDTRESPMRVRLNRLAGSIARFGYLGSAAVVLSYLFYKLLIENGFSLPRLLLDLFMPGNLLGTLVHCVMLAMSVIIMAVPEGLPMMITVVLSANMRRMLRDNVLVRKLVGIETAGSLNLLFTDKTGTLTHGQLALHGFVDGAGQQYQDLSGLSRHPDLRALVHAGMVCGNASVISEEGAIGGNATDRALLEAATGIDIDPGTLHTQVITPFDSTHKFSVTKARGRLNKVLVKGAPDRILSACDQYIGPSGEALPLLEPQQTALEKQIKTLSSKAARLIALATSDQSPQRGALPDGLALIGLVALRDTLRPEAIEGVARVMQAGVQVVMITGDSRDTAMAIAREASLVSDPAHLALTSSDLAAMDDRALTAALPKLRVMARALPGDKSRLVRIAQQAGMVTGMTGDGINDAPALKLADVGFAMGSGAEIAKEAGDVVILDDNFASIGRAILYGRTIFKSIRKFIIFQLTVNLCAVALAVLGPFFGVETPITVLQMLWINMVMDTLAGLAFSGEPPLQEYMNEPPKKRDAPILNRYMASQILVTGLYTMALCLWFLVTGYGLTGGSGAGYRLTAFFGLFMFAAICNAANARTHRLNLLHHLRQNPLFSFVMGLVLLIQVGMLFVGGPLFRVAQLSLQDLVWTMCLASTVIPVDMMRKAVSRRLWGMEQGV
ncbi:MAG: calcium-translocating P-type ATPase, PMCA-type [Clostridia bacterium]|nr:calcium-translocating P-type ATPase, PMCA-type [Clostridia bacterium]